MTIRNGSGILIYSAGQGLKDTINWCPFVTLLSGYVKNLIDWLIAKKKQQKTKKQKNETKTQKQMLSRAVTVRDVHYCTNSDIRPCGEVKRTDIPKDGRDAGGLQISLTVSKGTRMILSRNIFQTMDWLIERWVM